MTENKVSIVVPVYNAQKWLGYCLNSLLAQTWTEFEVILVNDGSTDDSLEICRNYAELDSRFRVLDVPNGGVSRARNLGVSQATGRYLVFVDSDDVVTPDMLEVMLDCARRTGMELVAGDMSLVDFARPEAPRGLLCARWAGEGERVYDKEAFARNRMRLIFNTSLLEGPCAKLYSLDLWRKLDLQFPPELSLGEDFVTNMQYYAACNGIAFLNRTVYYYNNESQSNSLTHQYRKDLFETKMYLIERLREFIGPQEEMDPDEWSCYCSYVACTGFKCLAAVVSDERFATQEARLEEVRKIVDDPLFREGCARNSWIPDDFVAARKAVLDGDAEKTLHILQTPTPQLVQKKRELEEKVQAKKAGFKTGCKHVLQKVLYPLQRLNRYINRLQTQELQNQLQNMAVHSQKLQLDASLSMAHERQKADFESWMTEVLDRKSQEHAAELATLQQTLDQFRPVLSATDTLEQLKSDMEMVRGALWNETKTFEQQQVMELRQKKKALMLATAEHQNIGDAAIDLAEQNLLLQYFPDYFQVEFSTYEMPNKYHFLQAIVNPSDILFINGGGNMGSLYREEEELHRRIVQDFPNNKIVILPQTIYFADTPEGQAELALSARVYNHHKDLTIFARGRESYDFACRHFYNARVRLMADVVLALHRDYGFDRSGVLLCLRGDGESVLAQQNQQILDTVQRIDPDVEIRTNIAQQDISRVERAAVVNDELQRYARRRVVVTDRLHGMIFAAVTGTPCVVLDNATHKSRDFYRTFLQDSNAVFYIGTDCDRLEEAIAQALAVENPVYGAFDRALFADLAAVHDSM